MSKLQLGESACAVYDVNSKAGIISAMRAQSKPPRQLSPLKQVAEVQLGAAVVVKPSVFETGMKKASNKKHISNSFYPSPEGLPFSFMRR